MPDDKLKKIIEDWSDSDVRNLPFYGYQKVHYGNDAAMARHCGFSKSSEYRVRRDLLLLVIIANRFIHTS